MQPRNNLGMVEFKKVVGMVILGFRHVEGREAYSFDCPAGVFIGRLDARAWGKRSNLLLFVSETEGPGRYCLSVWWENDYGPRIGGVDFRNEAVTGELYRFEVVRSPGGANLMRAERVAVSADAGVAARPG